jgi:hypothetical protein
MAAPKSAGARVPQEKYRLFRQSAKEYKQLPPVNGDNRVWRAGAARAPLASQT